MMASDEAADDVVAIWSHTVDPPAPTDRECYEDTAVCGIDADEGSRGWLLDCSISPTTIFVPANIALTAIPIVVTRIAWR